MIEHTGGDILKAEAQALVNTVNCVGFMGRGIAAQFKRAFPANFDAYASACKREAVQPGRMFVHETGALTNPRFIVNFPTKRHWSAKSRIEDIESGLQDLARQVDQLGIASIAIPPLGCGLGGLEWSEVRPRIEAAFASLPDVCVLLFHPGPAPTAERMARSKSVPKMTPGRAVLVSLMEQYLGGLMAPFVSLLEVHKLMYFMQEAGEPLRLKYKPALYGPYAENLRHVLTAIEGHFVQGYADGGDTPDKLLRLVPGAMADASRVLVENPEVQERFRRVAELVEGFETPFGMELLATVHWVGAHGGARDAESATVATYAWNDRKRAFSHGQIELAWEVLGRQGWLRGAA